MNKYSNTILFCFIILLFYSCKDQPTSTMLSAAPKKPFTIITLDPGHFHAALVQKSIYEDVDSNVYVYSNPGSDLDMHMQRIHNYNTRKDNPTTWNEVVYTQPDFFEKMIADRKAPGNVVVLSGNNISKPDYIYNSLQAGLNVFADKPMIIKYDDFEKLKASFAVAAQKNLLLYDIMTERYEVSTALQRLLSTNNEIFGTLVPGSPSSPSITKESVHHFYKFVSGNVLVRPQWFMDVKQQGEGLVDVMTHLVDLVQWECFPEALIDTTEIKIITSYRWPTKMSQSQFNTITKANGFPDYLKENVKDTVLHVYSNGEINYTIKGIHAKTSVIWNYQAPDGTGDTHYSIMKGSIAHLEIKQGKEENFKPTLYIIPLKSVDENYITAINTQLKSVEKEWPGITLELQGKRIKVNIPAEVQVGHEAHFAQVMAKYLSYLKNKNIPAWEVPNMITKYYTTTKALEMAQEK